MGSFRTGVCGARWRFRLGGFKMSGETTKQQRDERWREGSDVYQHCYAFHHQSLRTAERSSESHTISDELWWAAKVNEGGDRKLADLLRRAQARINALETLCLALRNGKPCEIPLDGKPE